MRISSGENHMAIVDDQYQLFMMGSNDSYQCGLETNHCSVCRPQQVCDLLFFSLIDSNTDEYFDSLCRVWKLLHFCNYWEWFCPCMGQRRTRTTWLGSRHHPLFCAYRNFIFERYAYCLCICFLCFGWCRSLLESITLCFWMSLEHVMLQETDIMDN